MPQYGGVVPELASRDHVRRLLPLIHTALADAGTQPEQIDGVAYTAGPGLVGALLVGGSVARSLAFAWGRPALGVHHLEGHLLAPMLEAEPPEFPFLALLVSGGHTLLAVVRGLGDYQIIGSSLDDAAGEAFDKTAKLLGLPYPGRPGVGGARAQRAAREIPVPAADARSSGPRFQLQRSEDRGGRRDARRAARRADARRCCAASSSKPWSKRWSRNARAQLRRPACRRSSSPAESARIRRCAASSRRSAERAGLKILYPRPEFCTDNAAMIAYAGYRRLAGGEHDELKIRATARWPLDTLRPPPHSS